LSEGREGRKKERRLKKADIELEVASKAGLERRHSGPRALVRNGEGGNSIRSQIASFKSM